jgi:hypothetical protein
MELIKSEIPDEHDSKERMWVYKDNKEIFDKYSQIAMNQETTPIIVEQPKKQEKITKIGKINKKNTPLELIIQYTSSSENMKREIKEKLIELISLPEFSKAFGVKKSAEIISAITRDSWNQSTALFISFLLDSSIVYKEKPYIYNKDKVTKEIVVMN